MAETTDQVVRELADTRAKVERCHELLDFHTANMIEHGKTGFVMVQVNFENGRATRTTARHEQQG